MTKDEARRLIAGMTESQKLKLLDMLLKIQKEKASP